MLFSLSQTTHPVTTFSFLIAIDLEIEYSSSLLLVKKYGETIAFSFTKGAKIFVSEYLLDAGLTEVLSTAAGEAGLSGHMQT